MADRYGVTDRQENTSLAQKMTFTIKVRGSTDRPVISAAQREALNAVRAAMPNWYRAAHSGQRVTLASLWRRDVLERRAWRGVEGEADAAHEYRLSPTFVSALATPIVEAQLRCVDCSADHPPEALRKPCGATGCECWCNR